MSTTSKSFFAAEENAAAIRSFAALVRGTSPLSEPYPEVVSQLNIFFQILSANLSHFDEHCTANIEWLGPRFIGQLSSYSGTSEEKKPELLISIFTFAYRLVCELDFSQPGELSFELRGIRSFVFDNLEKFQGTDRQQLIYANYAMPANIAKRLLQDPSLGDFKAFNSSAKAARELKQTWDKEITEKMEEMATLRNAVAELKTNFNFIGLVKGFENLHEETLKRRNRAKWFSLFLAFALIGPLLSQLYLLSENLDKLESIKPALIFAVPPIVALELVLLYFFRISLSNLRDLKSQLLQLDLRISLCQFIQSYSEYSTKIKQADASALEKFEAIVFSPILPDGDRIPSTFDGVDQLAKLVASVRGK